MYTVFRRVCWWWRWRATCTCTQWRPRTRAASAARCRPSTPACRGSTACAAAWGNLALGSTWHARDMTYRIWQIWDEMTFRCDMAWWPKKTKHDEMLTSPHMTWHYMTLHAITWHDTWHDMTHDTWYNALVPAGPGRQGVRRAWWWPVPATSTRVSCTRGPWSPGQYTRVPWHVW